MDGRARQLPGRIDVKDPRHGARSALVILFAINLVDFVDRNMFGAVAEPIRKEWELNETALVLLYALGGSALRATLRTANVNGVARRKSAAEAVE